MSPCAVRRREDRALISAWSRRIFRDGALCGRAHPVDDGCWLAEDFCGRMLGSYPTERAAVRAVLDAGRRG
jgi:hypothetical protein